MGSLNCYRLTHGRSGLKCLLVAIISGISDLKKPPTSQDGQN